MNSYCFAKGVKSVGSQLFGNLHSIIETVGESHSFLRGVNVVLGILQCTKHMCHSIYHRTLCPRRV